jgi:hypothetical protein
LGGDAGVIGTIFLATKDQTVQFLVNYVRSYLSVQVTNLPDSIGPPAESAPGRSEATPTASDTSPVDYTTRAGGDELLSETQVAEDASVGG